MAHYDLHMPVSETDVRKLRINDTVTLHDTLFGIRDASYIALFDRQRTTRFNLNGHAVIHTAPNVKKVPVSPENPAGYAAVCIGTTTSDRMERFTRQLMTQTGVRFIIGKGGMREGSLAQIEDVDLDDLNPESLWKFALREPAGFGPLLVAMDSNGGSLYDAVNASVADRRAAALASLGISV